jgi:hypothetical protein
MSDPLASRAKRELTPGMDVRTPFQPDIPDIERGNEPRQA